MAGIDMPIPPHMDGIVMWFSLDGTDYAVMAENMAEVEFILTTHGTPTKIELTRNTY
jgi:hypothetical protein